MIMFCLVYGQLKTKSKVVECHMNNEAVVIKLGIMKIDFQ